MMWRQAASGDGVGVGYREFPEAHVSDPLSEVRGASEVPDTLFDGDLLKGDRREEDVRLVA
ncbi:hypothetical protein GCM10009848_01190 [Micromonospora lupini]